MTFNLVIERFNLWSELLVRIAWPLFWQSSILISGMFLLDVFLRRTIRPSVRHALWLVVLAKLLLPPSFAFPSGLAWWLRPREVASVKQPAPQYVVTYGPSNATAPLATARHRVIPDLQVHFSNASRLVMGTCGISLALLIAMLARWRMFRRELCKSESAPVWLQEIVIEAQRKIRHRGKIRLRLTEAAISPALFGLFRPVIVLPVTLIDRLTPTQLRAVLLHELIHLRNGDIWINCFQSLLQIAFWWHPLVWLANARIRRIREEVVDDAVRFALRDEAETYAPTLLEVARLTLARPLATLGLVGILESRNALRQRVERMVTFPVPKRAGLTLGSIFGILAFTSVAVPMGQAPPKKAKPIVSNGQTLHYSFDQTFLEYFGTNGAAALNETLNQFKSVSNSSRYNGNLPEFSADSGRIDSQTDLSSSGGIADNVTNLQRLAQNQPMAIDPGRGRPPINGRKSVMSKLEAIHLNHVVFDNLPLSEVVNYLREESRKRDPEGKGINFLMMPYAGESAPPTIDPATGQAVPAPQSEPTDINAVSIRIVPSLDDVRMLDVLDAIIKVADKRIRYSIEDYGVSFRLAANDGAAPLYSRTFKVDPNTFAQGLEGVVGVSVGNFQTGGQGGGGGGQQGNNNVTVPRVQVAPNGVAGQVGPGGAQGGGGGISGVTRPTTMISPQSVNKFLANAGVKLTPPKSAFYNDRAGTLLVHASLNELDAIENALGATTFNSAQLSSPTNEQAASNSVSSLTKEAKRPFTPLPQINIKARFVEIAKGKTQKAFSDLGWPGRSTANSGDTNACLSQVLTDPEFHIVLHALEQRDDTDVLTTSSVTTLSERQAQIQAVDMQTIPLKVNPQALTPPGVRSTNLFITENIPLGPILDVIPVVAGDGIAVSLNVTATIKQHLGYDESTDSEQVQVYVDGKLQTTKPPLPRFRVRQIHTVATFIDGQTLMLGKPTDVVMTYDKDGNVVNEPGIEDKDLLVFLTTTLIDPVGNPIHPLAPATIPSAK